MRAVVTGPNGFLASDTIDTEFVVIDRAAPYVVLGVPPAAEGVWDGLEPDYLGQDPDGWYWFAPGMGGIRKRLADIGVTKEEWEALPRRDRGKVLKGALTIGYAEGALRDIVKRRNPSVVAKAEKYLGLMVAHTVDARKAPRGLSTERRRPKAFRLAKRLLPILAVELDRVRQEGLALRRSPFESETWARSKADEINQRTVALGLGEPCSARDIAELKAGVPNVMAKTIASRATGVGADSLRYSQARTRAKGAPRVKR